MPTQSQAARLPGPPAATARHPSSVPVAAFYFAWLAALGLFIPYFGLYLRSLGLSETRTTELFAVMPAMGMVSPPLLGLLADARRARPWLLRGATMAATVVFFGFFVVGSNVAGLFAVAALFSLVRTPVGPLVDAAAAELSPGGHGFGRLRLWGSIGFLVAVAGVGPLLDRLGVGAMRGATVVGLVASSAMAWLMPAPSLAHRPEVLAAWRRLVASGPMRRFLAAVLLAQAAGAAYDAAFSLHLARLGYDKGFVGAAWAVGVIAEVAVLAYAPRLLGRVAPARLLAFAITVAAARWALLSRVTAAWAIMALQPLHGITFGLWFVPAVVVAQRRGREAPTAAQGLMTGTSSAGSVIGMIVAGRLLERGGGALMFGCSALVALVAAGVAWRFAADEDAESAAAALTHKGAALG